MHEYYDLLKHLYVLTNKHAQDNGAENNWCGEQWCILYRARCCAVLVQCSGNVGRTSQPTYRGLYSEGDSLWWICKREELIYNDVVTGDSTILYIGALVK